jgi:GTP cyclohydrolase I
MSSRRSPSDMPDISHELPSTIQYKLDRVGMTDMQFPIHIVSEKQDFRLPAKIDAFVNLGDPKAKGIHMSRLYLLVRDALTEAILSRSVLEKLLNDFLSSHKGLSDRAKIKLSFELPLARPALVSKQNGWRTYPVEIEAELREGKLDLILKFTMMYASTCPCSAALSRQLVQEKFLEDMKGRDTVSTSEVGTWLRQESSIIATPHAQRSLGRIQVRTEKSDLVLEIKELIDAVEDAVKTPVQATVKREDEQEFAHLNGTNLMFCEDASRRIKQVLEKNSSVSDYAIEVEHIESLHPHSAVSAVSKGVSGGFGS